MWLSVFAASCGKPDIQEDYNVSPELAAIDSLMWQQPDSALKVMLEFAGSEEADILNEFEGHYCQVLIAELLYKNDYGQSNREEVLKAVHYFDSIVGMDGANAYGKADTRGVAVQKGVSVREREAFWRRGRIILMVWGFMNKGIWRTPVRNTSTLCG